MSASLRPPSVVGTLNRSPHVAGQPTIDSPATEPGLRGHCTPRRGRGPRLVMAHGFTQTGQVWGSLDRTWPATTGRDRGHAGTRGSTDVAVDLAERGPAVGRGGGEATYIGYSMGARFCLHLALAQPALSAAWS